MNEPLCNGHTTTERLSRSLETMLPLEAGLRPDLQGIDHSITAFITDEACISGKPVYPTVQVLLSCGRSRGIAILSVQPVHRLLRAI